MINSVACTLDKLDIKDAATLLQEGGILIYPTETFWAIGCSPQSPAAIDAIYRIKGRFHYKPLPLLAADRDQAAAIVDLAAAPPALLENFWPGPLTLILPARYSLHRHLQNADGKAAIRVTASRIACLLTKMAGTLLTCSSANIQAHQPGQDIEELDQDFWHACAASSAPIAICDAHVTPKNMPQPSTMVEPEFIKGRWQLRLVRKGAISANELQNPEWDIVQ